MIEILKLDHQGRGIGKINNKIIFIKNALPKELVEVKIIKDKKNYQEGIVTNYIKKSDKRINPKCPYYEQCGGCNLMHLNYQDQIKYKQEKIENIIHKYVDKFIKVNKIIPSENIYNYRNKVTFHVNNKIGLYEDNTNNIIEIKKCLLADNKINKILKELKTLKLNKDEITVRSSYNDSLIYYKNKDNLININCNNIINNNTIIKGNNYIIEKLNDFKFIISPTSFFQVNTQQTIILYDLIKKLAKPNKNDILLDLYCGTGTIGLYLSKESKEILGIELNKEAIIDANKNKKLNNINNAKFIAGDAKEIIKKINYKPDIIIVDPPRSGLYKGMIKDLISFNAKKIIYVSCDPITLSRDLKELKEKYKIKEIQPVDLFPNTYHIENIVLLEKM